MGPRLTPTASAATCASAHTSQSWSTTRTSCYPWKIGSPRGPCTPTTLTGRALTTPTGPSTPRIASSDKRAGHVCPPRTSIPLCTPSMSLATPAAAFSPRTELRNPSISRTQTTTVVAPWRRRRTATCSTTSTRYT